MAEMRQFELEAGPTRTVAWLPDDSRLRPGTRLTLKTHPAPERMWTVRWRSALTKPREALRTDWRVGGL